jgi:transposase
MRYSDGGGLTAEGRSRRERVRLRAAQMYDQGMDPVQIAGLLRVSAKSAYQWRRAWASGGEAALASRGPGGTGCKLDDGQLARLRAALDAGPAAYGWGEDQRWTLARVTELIRRLFRVSYTLRGVSYLLHRNGFTPQVPAHRATERNEAAIAEWRAVTWAKARG